MEITSVKGFKPKTLTFLRESFRSGDLERQSRATQYLVRRSFQQNGLRASFYCPTLFGLYIGVGDDRRPAGFVAHDGSEIKYSGEFISEILNYMTLFRIVTGNFPKVPPCYELMGLPRGMQRPIEARVLDGDFH